MYVYLLLLMGGARDRINGYGARTVHNSWVGIGLSAHTHTREYETDSFLLGLAWAHHMACQAAMCDDCARVDALMCKLSAGRIIALLDWANANGLRKTNQPQWSQQKKKALVNCHRT
jgi:hypothetical protein